MGWAMTAIGVNSSAASGLARRFYLIMAVLIGATILAGFSRTVPYALTTPPGLPLLLHVHGFVFLSWLVLFAVQPWLIGAGNVALHRKLGWVGAILALLMTVMGVAATLFALATHIVPPFFPPSIFLAMNLIGIAFFAGLVTAAVAMRKSGDWHKRLLLCATCLLLGPGLGRLLPMSSFGAAAPLVLFGVVDLYLLAGPVFDLFTRRRIHPAYFWGVPAVLLSEILIGPVGMAPPTIALAHKLAGG